MKRQRKSQISHGFFDSDISAVQTNIATPAVNSKQEAVLNLGARNSEKRSFMFIYTVSE